MTINYVTRSSTTFINDARSTANCCINDYLLLPRPLSLSLSHSSLDNILVHFNQNFNLTLFSAFVLIFWKNYKSLHSPVVLLKFPIQFQSTNQILCSFSTYLRYSLRFPSTLTLVSTDDILNHGTAQWTVATADSSPLLHGTLVAHAHVAAGVQDGVDRILVADCALGRLGIRLASSGDCCQRRRTGSGWR